MKTIFVDLDGTICTEEKTFSRSLAKPIEGASEAIYKLMDAGFTVVIYTARSWAEWEMTVDWLSRNKIPYAGIHMGKPIADIWIDDRAIRFEDWDSTLEKVLG